MRGQEKIKYQLSGDESEGGEISEGAQPVVEGLLAIIDLGLYLK